MEPQDFSITVSSLREILEKNQDVLILDVRPLKERQEWKIPGSIHLDAYQRLRDGDFSVMDEIKIPKNSKVVTVCAAGRTSQIASNELRKRGVDAYSLEGGMKAWSVSWNTARLSFPDEELEIVQVRRTGKGCLSYLVSSKGSAIIIDPSLDIEVYEKILGENQLQLKYVLETHTHADHLSRAFLLAEKFNAELILPALSRPAFEFTPIIEGEVLSLNTISLRAISTPGHTYDSTCYLINGLALVTGDTLFTDSIGRPDLRSSEEESRVKARALFTSLQRLLLLNKDIVILPGHASRPIEFNNIMLQSTLGEARQNIAMLGLKEEEFVEEVLSRIPPTPENYLEIVENNIKGERIINPELEVGANRCAIN